MVRINRKDTSEDEVSQMNSNNKLLNTYGTTVRGVQDVCTSKYSNQQRTLTVHISIFQLGDNYIHLQVRS